jgi:hypothetical protein
MKIFLILLTVPVLMSKTCKKNQAGGGTPACVQQKIDSIKQQPRWNPPAQVDEYEYKGKRIFLFSSPCCDQYNIAWDGNCQYVCAPSGGLTGKGDGKCADFNNAAKHIRLVWKDER